MSKRVSKRLFGRCRTASGVIMATTDLMILLPIVVAGVACLCDFGELAWYKERLGFVLNQTANYAVNLPLDADQNRETERMLTALCTENCLQAAKLKIQVTKCTINDCEALTVNADVDVPLVKGSVLPAAVHLRDSATALVPANRICGAIAISPYPFSTENPDKNYSVYVPIVQPTRPLPVWQFPYDAALNNMHIVQGECPPVPAKVDPYFSSRPSIY
jgi:hypothetical protein